MNQQQIRAKVYETAYTVLLEAMDCGQFTVSLPDEAKDKDFDYAETVAQEIINNMMNRLDKAELTVERNNLKIQRKRKGK